MLAVVPDLLSSSILGVGASEDQRCMQSSLLVGPRPEVSRSDVIMLHLHRPTSCGHDCVEPRARLLDWHITSEQSAAQQTSERCARQRRGRCSARQTGRHRRTDEPRRLASLDVLGLADCTMTIRVQFHH